MSSRYNDRDYDREGRRSESDYGSSWSARSQDRYRYGESERGREGRDRDRGYGSEYGRGRQSGSPRDYQTQRYRGYGGSSYGQSSRGYEGRDYGESSGRYGRDYGQSPGEQDQWSESSQRYNYPTGFRSSQSYDERGRSYDYDRGSYGQGEGRDWGSRYGRNEEWGGDYGRDEGRWAEGRWGERDRGEERGWLDRAADTVASWFGDEEAERRRRMDQRREHRGRGPKGYRRSDERIREDINDRLSDDYAIDASDIEVTVVGTEVTLNGMVNSRNDKRRAEDIAESVSGVSNVENRLRVKQTGTGSYGEMRTSGTTGTGTSSAAAGGYGTGTSGTSSSAGAVGTTGTTDTGTTGTSTTGAGQETGTSGGRGRAKGTGSAT